jgi:hypothetical protein
MYGSVVEIHCGQEVVLLGRFAPGRLPHELLTRGRAQTVLSRLAATPDAMRKIRHYWSAHRSSHSVRRLSDHDLLKVVGGAIQNGQLQAIVFPRSWPDRTQGAAQVAGRQAPAAMAQTAQPRWPAAPAARSTLPGIASVPSEPAGFLPPASAQPRPLSQWSPEERIAEVIRRALPKVPGDVGQALLSLLTPESLAIIAGTIAIGAAANLTPYGWAADAFIMGVAFGFGGVAAIYALGDLVECFKRTANAQSDQDLDAAADALARALVALGAVGLMAVLHRVGMRKGGGGAGGANAGESVEAVPRTVSSGTVDRPTVGGSGTTPKAVEQPPVAASNPGASKSGAYFFDKQVLPYIDRADATLGRVGESHFFMPLEDSDVVTDAASAYRYSGGAQSLERAYVTGGDVYGIEFPLDGLTPRLPTAADATFPHFLEGGQTALKLPGGGYLVNPTREFVVPGGNTMPAGSVLFKIGPGGARIPIRSW